LAVEACTVRQWWSGLALDHIWNLCGPMVKWVGLKPHLKLVWPSGEVGWPQTTIELCVAQWWSGLTSNHNLSLCSPVAVMKVNDLEPQLKPVWHSNGNCLTQTTSLSPLKNCGFQPTSSVEVSKHLPKWEFKHLKVTTNINKIDANMYVTADNFLQYTYMYILYIWR
jgi:hypothetical protein